MFNLVFHYRYKQPFETISWRTSGESVEILLKSGRKRKIEDATTAKEIDYLSPGEIAESIIQVNSEGSWGSLAERFRETKIDYLEVQMQAISLKSAFMSFLANRPLPLDAISEIKNKCSEIKLRPHYEGWSFGCPDLLVCAWLEVYQIIQEGFCPIVQDGLRVKLCKKCNNPFIAAPPQRMHCSKCRQDDTWQVLNWQKKHPPKYKVEQQDPRFWVMGW